jgi:hypothetical protein
MKCDACQRVGMWHCSDVEHCGNMKDEDDDTSTSKTQIQNDYEAPTKVASCIQGAATRMSASQPN